MKREYTHYFAQNVTDVFNAYYTAATQKFGKDCIADQNRTLSFRIKFSVTYNMNGGMCIVQFAPYNSGTAVTMQMTVMQLAGGRCAAFDRDLTVYVQQLLNAMAASTDYRKGAQAYDAAGYAPGYQQGATEKRFCPNCGAPTVPGTRFCSNCGNAL